MNYNDIITLAKAGFTAQQIAALRQVSQQETVQQNMFNQAQPSQYVDTDTSLKEALNNVYGTRKPSYDALSQITQQMQELTNAVQGNNMLNMTQPKNQTADDVLAYIINPPMPENPPMEGGNL